MPHRLGAGALLLLAVSTAACTQSPPQAVVSPVGASPVASWTLDLNFTGDITGHMSGIVPNSGTSINECTGTRSHAGVAWADTFYGTTDGGPSTWGVTILVAGYRGPGSYTATDASVEVHSPDHGKVWSSNAGDSVAVTIGQTQDSGSVDAALTNASTGQSTLHVSGKFSCRG